MYTFFACMRVTLSSLRFDDTCRGKTHTHRKTQKDTDRHADTVIDTETDTDTDIDTDT